MEENMMDLYKQLSISNKRNEFSSLLMKIDVLLNEIIAKKNLQNNASVKNYDINKGLNLDENDILTFFYEDLWNIKNKILMLLAISDE